MYVSASIRAFSNYVLSAVRTYGNRGTPALVYGVPIFSPDLDFRDVALVKERIFQYFITTNQIHTNAEFTIKPWAVFAFNRESIQSTTPLGFRASKVRVGSPTIGDVSSAEVTIAWVSIKMTCVIFTNRMDMAEAIEELMKMQMRSRLATEVSYGTYYGKFVISASVEDVRKFEKLKTEEFGAVTAVEWENELVFPLVDAVPLSNVSGVDDPNYPFDPNAPSDPIDSMVPSRLPDFVDNLILYPNSDVYTYIDENSIPVPTP